MLFAVSINYFIQRHVMKINKVIFVKLKVQT